MGPGRLAALSLVLALFTPVCSHAWQNGLEARAEAFVDNDEAQSFTFDQVLLHRSGTTVEFGIGATQTLIRETGESRSLHGGLLEGYAKSGDFDVRGTLKLIDWDGRFRTPASLSSSQSFGRLRFEENLDFGTIDSVKAFDAHIDFFSAGGAVDCRIFDDLTATGGCWRRWSSDGNGRALYLGRLVFDLTDNYHVQYRYKGTRNRERVPEYFSPEAFDQHALLFGCFVSLFDRLRLKVWAGPVHQDDGYESATGALEDVRATLRIEGGWSLEARVEANQVGSGYRYVYSTLSVSYDF